MNDNSCIQATEALLLHCHDEKSPYIPFTYIDGASDIEAHREVKGRTTKSTAL